MPPRSVLHPKDPQIAVIVDDMRAFVFDVELASPDALLFQFEVMRDEVLEEKFASFGLPGKSEVAVGNAAKKNRAARVDFKATVHVREMFQRHDRRYAIDDAEVGLRLAVVVNPSARADNASYLSVNDDRLLHRIKAGQKDGCRT